MNSTAIGALAVLLVFTAIGFVYFTSHAPEATGPQEVTFSLVIEHKTLVEGPTVMTVVRGDLVTIRVRADEEEEFHLHGYDRSVDLMPNEVAELKFTADTAGRFIAELEHSKTEVVALEVQP